MLYCDPKTAERDQCKELQVSQGQQDNYCSFVPVNDDSTHVPLTHLKSQTILKFIQGQLCVLTVSKGSYFLLDKVISY